MELSKKLFDADLGDLSAGELAKLNEKIAAEIADANAELQRIEEEKQRPERLRLKRLELEGARGEVATALSHLESLVPPTARETEIIEAIKGLMHQEQSIRRAEAGGYLATQFIRSDSVQHFKK